jgi:hypothetical protein
MFLWQGIIPMKATTVTQDVGLIFAQPGKHMRRLMFKDVPFHEVHTAADFADHMLQEMGQELVNRRGAEVRHLWPQQHHTLRLCDSNCMPLRQRHCE